MSVSFYLVCHECRQKLWVAQDGLNGWSFYSGEKDCMRALSEWLERHTMDLPGHRFALHAEQTQSSEDYADIEWSVKAPRRADRA